MRDSITFPFGLCFPVFYMKFFWIALLSSYPPFFLLYFISEDTIFSRNKCLVLIFLPSHNQTSFLQQQITTLWLKTTQNYIPGLLEARISKVWLKGIKLKCQQGCTLSRDCRGNSVFLSFSLLEAASIPWFMGSCQHRHYWISASTFLFPPLSWPSCLPLNALRSHFSPPG